MGIITQYLLTGLLQELIPKYLSWAPKYLSWAWKNSRDPTFAVVFLQSLLVWSWWCRVKFVFLLVEVLLDLRGVQLSSTWEPLGFLQLVHSEHLHFPPKKPISWGTVARVLFVPLTWSLMSHCSPLLNLAGQPSTVISYECWGHSPTPGPIACACGQASKSVWWEHRCLLT